MWAVNWCTFAQIVNHMCCTAHGHGAPAHPVIPTNAAPPSAALTCPFCRSEKVATTSKSTDDAYWRCRESTRFGIRRGSNFLAPSRTAGRRRATDLSLDTIEETSLLSEHAPGAGDACDFETVGVEPASCLDPAARPQPEAARRARAARARTPRSVARRAEPTRRASAAACCRQSNAVRKRRRCSFSIASRPDSTPVSPGSSRRRVAPG